MKDPVEGLLEDDHDSLGKLLAELDSELAAENIPHAFELLDLFWARLAVHIRAENLHLFPALANAAASLFSGKGKLPTSEDAHNILLQLRSDHDFFMKELASMMKTARKIQVGAEPAEKHSEEFRKRLTAIRKRLEAHNVLEEEQVYTWPALLFDEQTVVKLGERLQRELENLPPRISESH
jgi:iron-sulfur cluster repair protein YtfE (RIC family)